MGSDLVVRASFFVPSAFQSTLPVWGATLGSPMRKPCFLSISIHAPRVGSDLANRRFVSYGGISIHAPRVGSDLGLTTPKQIRFLISIHAPRVGSDEAKENKAPPKIISIHAPRVGSDLGRLFPCDNRDISIHAPRVGSDTTILSLSCHTPDFNPRSPCGERRYQVVVRFCSVLYFNPRSPCGERLFAGVANVSR